MAKDDLPGVPPLNQLLVPETLWRRLTAWLNTQGLEAVKLPSELFEKEELPTYVIHHADYLAALTHTGRVAGKPADSLVRDPQADRLTTPWTVDQVTALNTFQTSGKMHPFTCGSDQHTLTAPTLVATPDGWKCRSLGCDYTQKWAHPFMVSVYGVCPVGCDSDCEDTCHEAHAISSRRHSHQPEDCPSLIQNVPITRKAT